MVKYVTLLTTLGKEEIHRMTLTCNPVTVAQERSSEQCVMCTTLRKFAFMHGTHLEHPAHILLWRQGNSCTCLPSSCVAF